MQSTIPTRLKNAWKSKTPQAILHSVWLFPAIMTIVLITLSSLQLSGSSIGLYHKIFYGDLPDKDLIANQPESIRSDEWMVNTQKAIAQKNNNFAGVNKNIGNGEDATLLADTPTRDWSTIFKPHNLGFLVLPFNNAFALRWWALSYLLVLSCYFFIVALLPRRKLLASLLSLGFLFSPFFQWWYAYGTLGSVYYSLFGAVVFMKLLNSKRRLHTGLWSILLAYIATCFILILYPPFQIPCALILFAFAVGYLFDQKKHIDKKLLRRNLFSFVGAIVLALAIIGLFLYQKHGIVTVIQNTAYPGQRTVISGGYSLEHLLSGDLSPIFQSPTRANAYSRPSIGATNQSESSNFILIFPFLLIPLMYFGYKKYKYKKQIDYTLLSLTVATVVFMAWMFIPGLEIIGKISLLDKVPQSRLLIGIGLLDFIFMILFIKNYSELREKRFNTYISSIYSLLIFIFFLLTNFHVMLQFPGFVGYRLAVVLALSVPVIIFCFVRRCFIVGAILLLGFSFASTFHINPIYRGTEVLTQTPVSNAIREIAGTSQKKWIGEDIILENFATMNGAPSITGTYLYPQLDIWKKLNRPDQEVLYNRYAHVNFTFDRNPNQEIDPVISSPGADQFNVKIEPCDTFLKQSNVGFLITSVEFSPGAASCANLVERISYPKITFYIYRLNL